MSENFELPQREGKPRKRGLTTMIDFGPDEMGWTGVPGGIEGLLKCAADYIDHAKIYAMNGLLLPEDTVKEAARLYRDYGCNPFAGGMLFEYAYAKGQLDEFEALLRREELMGFEISENYITLTDDERKGFIDRFQRAGFDVVYEFGRKAPTKAMELEELGAVIHSVAECGIEYVIVEQSEIDMLAETSVSGMDELRRQNWFDRIVIEADPYRFPQQHVELIEQFGPDVNLCNIAAGQVMRLEGFRRGIGRAVGYKIMDALI